MECPNIFQNFRHEAGAKTSTRERRILAVADTARALTLRQRAEGRINIFSAHKATELTDVLATIACARLNAEIWAYSMLYGDFVHVDVAAYEPRGRQITELDVAHFEGEEFPLVAFFSPDSDGVEAAAGARVASLAEDAQRRFVARDLAMTIAKGEIVTSNPHPNIQM